MKKSYRSALILTTIVILLAIMTAGCSTTQSGKVYSSSQAQRPLEVYYGTIIELRQVTIQHKNSGAGSVIGGVAGGILGSTIGSGRGRTLASVGGALAGMAAGTAAEKQIGTRPAIEFTIELDNGRLMAVVQEEDAFYRVGDRVRLLKADDGTWRVRQ